MACSSRFTNLGLMGPTRFGSMGEKNNYSMNNIVVVDHPCLFYLDSGYLGSYHVVTILYQFELHKN
jgi:hypothetical protein